MVIMTSILYNGANEYDTARIPNNKGCAQVQNVVSELTMKAIKDKIDGKETDFPRQEQECRTYVFNGLANWASLRGPHHSEDRTHFFDEVRPVSQRAYA